MLYVLYRYKYYVGLLPEEKIIAFLLHCKVVYKHYIKYNQSLSLRLWYKPLKIEKQDKNVSLLND